MGTCMSPGISDSFPCLDCLDPSDYGGIHLYRIVHLTSLNTCTGMNSAVSCISVHHNCANHAWAALSVLTSWNQKPQESGNSPLLWLLCFKMGYWGFATGTDWRVPSSKFCLRDINHRQRSGLQSWRHEYLHVLYLDSLWFTC